MSWVLPTIIFIYIVGVIALGNILTYDFQQKYGKTRGCWEILGLALIWFASFPYILRKYLFSKRSLNEG